MLVKQCFYRDGGGGDHIAPAKRLDTCCADEEITETDSNSVQSFVSAAGKSEGERPVMVAGYAGL